MFHHHDDCDLTTHQNQEMNPLTRIKDILLFKIVWHFKPTEYQVVFYLNRESFYILIWGGNFSISPKEIFVVLTRTFTVLVVGFNAFAQRQSCYFQYPYTQKDSIPNCYGNWFASWSWFLDWVPLSSALKPFFSIPLFSCPYLNFWAINQYRMDKTRYRMRIWWLYWVGYIELYLTHVWLSSALLSILECACERQNECDINFVWWFWPCQERE